MFSSGFMAIKRFMAARMKRADVVCEHKLIPEKT